MRSFESGRIATEFPLCSYAVIDHQLRDVVIKIGLELSVINVFFKVRKTWNFHRNERLNLKPLRRCNHNVHKAMAQFLALLPILFGQAFRLLGKTPLRMIDEHHKRNARIVIKVVQLVL